MFVEHTFCDISGGKTQHKRGSFSSVSIMCLNTSAHNLARNHVVIVTLRLTNRSAIATLVVDVVFFLDNDDNTCQRHAGNDCHFFEYASCVWRLV